MGVRVGPWEGWVLKNWCFRIVVLEKTLLRVPWTAWRSNQSILKGINPEYLLKGLLLQLKLQYFGHLMRKANSLEKILMLRKIEGKRRSRVAEDEMVKEHHQLNGCEFEQTPGNSEGQRSLVCCSPWGLQRVGQSLATEQQQCHVYIMMYKYGN